MKPNEYWKDVPKYKGLYRISNMGRVFSMTKNIILSFNVTTTGYNYVYLYKKGNRTKFRLHRLVALSFMGKSNLQVNHINGIKTDNRLENLEYCTSKQNVRHSWKIGLSRKELNVRLGEQNGASKLKVDQVIEIKKCLEFGATVKGLARKFKVASHTIRSIKQNKTWRFV